MKLGYVFLVLFLVFSCSTSKYDGQRNTPEAHLDTPPPPSTIKPNITLIGAVITAINFIDDLQYTLEIELRTAIPERQSESYAEPGQHLQVVPSYQRNELGVVDTNDARNRRLLEVRSKGIGDFLFGKITLSNDWKWYLIDTEFR
jgi:hypothetical protein